MKSLTNQKFNFSSSSNVTSKKPFFFTSILYLLAAISECVWPYILYQNFDQVKRWIAIPMIGWAMIIIFIGLLVAIPFLFVIGAKLLILIKGATQVAISPQHLRQRKSVNMLLIIGLIADIFFSLFLILGDIKDRSLIPFGCALFAGRILQANFEAIALYFSVKKQ